MISIIVAVDENWLIGKGDGLPWRIKEDLKHFRKVTEGRKIIVGWNTYRSLPDLPNRELFVVSRDISFSPVGFTHVSDLQKFLEEIKDSKEEFFVIGGKQIYEQSYKYATKLYISEIKGKHEGDVFLNKPNFEDFELIETDARERFTIKIWQRK